MRYAIVLGLLIAGPLQAQTPPIERLDSVFARYRGTDGPGCAVAVSRKGELLAARGYGMADLDQGIAINPQSIFHVASVSKEFTAMTMILLAQRGVIRLDDDVRKYLPELPSYGQPITIRHLLHHTSGLRDQWSLLIEAGWRLGDDLITEQDVLDIVTRQRGLNFPPGTDWLYSNTGFTLAAIIVKRATGKSLRQYAGEALFQPLGMTRTHFHDDNGMIVPGRTRGYGWRDGQLEEIVPNYSTVGATSLFTTVVDFVRWHQELDEGTVGGKAAVTELTTPGVLLSGDTLTYALGIQLGTYRGQPTWSHGGGDPGYRTHLLHFPALEAGVTVFCNLNEANPQRLAEQTADIYFAADLAPVAAAGDSAARGALTGATGLYWSDQTEDASRLRLEHGTLTWGSGRSGAVLRALTDRKYQIGTGPATIELSADGSIRVVPPTRQPIRFVKTEEWTATAADRAALAGRYASDELGVTWEIRAVGDSLFLERRKFPRAAMVPLIRDTYTTRGRFGGFVIRATRDKGGRITGFTVGSGRVRRLPFRRVPTE